VKHVVVMTPPDARHGFTLTGVRQQTLVPSQLLAELRACWTTPQSASSSSMSAWPRAGAGVAARDGAALARHVRDAAGARAGARLEEAYVLRLIRRAIGYQVRLGA